MKFLCKISYIYSVAMEVEADDRQQAIDKAKDCADMMPLEEMGYDELTDAQPVMPRKFSIGQKVFVYNRRRSCRGYGTVLADKEVSKDNDTVLVNVNGTTETAAKADNVYELAGNTICRSCGGIICFEHPQRPELPYYCPQCEDSKFGFEVEQVSEEQYVINLAASEKHYTDGARSLLP